MGLDRLAVIKQPSTRLALLSLSAIAGALMFVSSGEPLVEPLRGTWLEPILLFDFPKNSIVFGLSTGFLTSVFFWWLVVHRPEVRRRSVLKKSLADRYREVRQRLIQELVWASSSVSKSTDTQSLLDPQIFKAVITRQAWYDFANALQGDPAMLHRVLLEFELLAMEVRYVMSSLPVDDQSLHRLLQVAHEISYRLRHRHSYGYDDIKFLVSQVRALLDGETTLGKPTDNLIEQLIKQV